MKRPLFFLLSLLLLSSTLFGGDFSSYCPCDEQCDWDPCNPCSEFQRCVVWLPEGPPLFRHFQADPRQMTFSAGWRFNDDIFHENTGPVSFGDNIAIARWYNPFGQCGVFQFEVEGCVWAIFKQTAESAPLVNADYYIAFPFVYRNGCWGYRVRFYHISSHIGDEFLLSNPNFDRRNASSEFMDFYVSYDPCRTLRFFGGIGAIVRSDESFRRKEIYLEYGAEAEFPQWGFYHERSRLIGEPFIAAHIRHAAEHRYRFDHTYVAGYQFGKRCGSERKVRIFAEYHKGFSAEGQFCVLKTDYITLRVSYGY